MAGSKHTSSTSFKKGTSGNPGGRSPRVGPNGETWTQLLRTKTQANAEHLNKLCVHPEPEIALKALTLWAPHAWGAPPKAGEGEDGKPDLAEVLLQLLDKLPS